MKGDRANGVQGNDVDEGDEDADEDAATDLGKEKNAFLFLLLRGNSFATDAADCC